MKIILTAIILTFSSAAYSAWFGTNVGVPVDSARCKAIKKFSKVTFARASEYVAWKASKEDTILRAEKDKLILFKEDRITASADGLLSDYVSGLQNINDRGIYEEFAKRANSDMICEMWDMNPPIQPIDPNS